MNITGREITILRNVRRLKSGAWNKRHTNRHVCSEIFGLGSTTAHNLCIELKIDPDGKTI